MPLPLAIYSIPNTNTSASTRTNFNDLLLCFLLLCVSGNPLFMFKYSYSILFIFLILFFHKKLTGIALRSNIEIIVKWMILILLIFTGQVLTNEAFSIAAYGNFIIKFLIGAIIFLIVGTKFSTTYFKIMYFLSLISLILFPIGELVSFMPLVSIKMFNNYYSIIIYGQYINLGETVHRNSGMFWEPGAFATHIGIGYLLNIYRLKDILKTKESIIQIIALVTTFSTTGYIFFMIVIAYFYFFKSNRRLLLLLFAPVLFISFYFIYDSPFMKGKISRQYANLRDYDVQSGIVLPDRFSSALLDWYYIKKNPVFGNGFTRNSMYGDHISKTNEWALNGMGNGFTSTVNSFGIVFVLIFFFTLYRKLPSTDIDSLLFIFLLIILMIGDLSLQSPLIIGLLFYQYSVTNSCN